MNNINLMIVTKQMNYGGTEKVILSLCRQLKGRVGKIVVVSHGGVYVKYLKKLGIHHYTIENPDKKNISKSIRTIKALHKIITRNNINVIHSHHRMTSFYCDIHNRFYAKIPVVTTYHYLSAGVEKYFMQENDANVAVSNTVWEWLVHYCGFLSTHVCTIVNGIKEPTPHDLLTVPALPRGNKTVTCIGRLEEGKGFEFFLQSIPLILRKCPNTNFIVVGDGTNKQKLQSLAADLHITEHVSFLGYRQDVYNIIRSSTIIVSTSLAEGFGLVAIEGFALGTPVIATKISAHQEIIRDHSNGILIQPKNPQDTAKKVIMLLHNKSLQRKIVRNAKRDFKTKYGEKRMAEDYLRIYRRLAP